MFKKNAATGSQISPDIIQPRQGGKGRGLAESKVGNGIAEVELVEDQLAPQVHSLQAEIQAL